MAAKMPVIIPAPLLQVVIMKVLVVLLTPVLGVVAVKVHVMLLVPMSRAVAAKVPVMLPAPTPGFHICEFQQLCQHKCWGSMQAHFHAKCVFFEGCMTG